MDEEITLVDAAKILEVTPNRMWQLVHGKTIRRLTRNGKPLDQPYEHHSPSRIDGRKLGRDWVVRVADVQAYAATEHRPGPQRKP